MTRLRKTIASRLVEVQQNAALLTTVNEADMSAVMELRSRFKQRYLDEHGIKLGFMSFFVKAVIEALKEYPALNAELRGDAGGEGLVGPGRVHLQPYPRRPRLLHHPQPPQRLNIQPLGRFARILHLVREPAAKLWENGPEGRPSHHRSHCRADDGVVGCDEEPTFSKKLLLVLP